ncbi:MAG: alpha/beta hydrolase fold domain-containing protein [Anaerolineales bacterium]|nr:alpha/beta hydrolase fold domain-containing protein [Anaerolineales bacterium]
MTIDWRRSTNFQRSDCYAATEWAATHAAELNGDSTRLAVAGDSAGGNLAVVVCALAREIGSVRIAFQALFYPVTNFDFTTLFYQECGADYFLTTDMMQWFWESYSRSESDGSDWRASPLRLPNVRLSRRRRLS